jgi:uncharacterized protein (DUF488 family)
MMQSPALIIFTIGHSTRSLDEFTAMLKEQGVGMVVDVRTVPRSRHNPQYNGDALPQALREHGIGYEHMPCLGGLRHAKKDSVNTGWENASFRGFADYMQTTDFVESLQQLIDRARTIPTAIMCAEAVPWRCHRSLIGDALLVRGIAVKDLIGKGNAREHLLTPWARVEGERITYPAAEQTQGRQRST